MKNMFDVIDTLINKAGDGFNILVQYQFYMGVFNMVAFFFILSILIVSLRWIKNKWEELVDEEIFILYCLIIGILTAMLVTTFVYSLKVFCPDGAALYSLLV